MTKTLTTAAGSICLCLAACSSLPPVQVPPQEIRVTEVQYAPIPAADTTPCPKPTAGYRTGADLLAHDAAETARADCDEKLMADIAKKQGSPVGAPAAATAPPHR